MGNVLRRDDGFGVEVARRLLATADLPANVIVVEVGIGGISLVQELMTQPAYDMLLVIDAVQQNGAPGQVYVLEADVPELDDLPEPVRRDFLADMHYAVPARALILAKALGVLPARTLIVGCQPEAHDDFAIGLSRPVAAAVEAAVVQIKTFLGEVTAP
jgi:hydrogenase maturation protease